MSDQIPILQKKSKNVDTELLNTMGEITKYLKSPNSKTDKKQPKSSNEFFKKQKQFIGDIGNNLATSVSSVFKSKDFTSTLSKGLLGPLSIITDPINNMFNITGKAGSFFGGLFDKSKQKKQEKRSQKLTEKKFTPKRNTLAKQGLLGAIGVYLGDQIGGGDSKKKKKGIGGLFKGLLGGAGGMAGKLAPFLLKALPIAAIVGSLLWAVFDGLAGLKKAKEWGVSGQAGFLGGFFGGSGKGWKNAFKNAGKWALMGVGAGFLLGGPIGAIVGGLLGGAIGGILGFIGGKKLAQAFEAIGNWFIGAFKATKKFIVNVGKTIGNAATVAFNFVKEKFLFVFNIVKNIISGIFKIFTNFFKASPKEKKKMVKLLFSKVKNIVGSLFNFITDPLIKIFPILKKPFDKIKEFASSVFDGIGGFVGNIAEGFGKAQNFVKSRIINPIGNLIKEFIIQPLAGPFNAVVSFFKNLVRIFEPLISTFRDLGLRLEFMVKNPLKAFSEEEFQDFRKDKAFSAYVKSYRKERTGEFSIDQQVLQKKLKNIMKEHPQAKTILDEYRKFGNFTSDGKAISPEEAFLDSLRKGIRYTYKDGEATGKTERLPVNLVDAILKARQSSISSYDIGGKVRSNQMAYLRKDEVVLSPFQSKKFLSGMEDKSIQNVLEGMNQKQYFSQKANEETVFVLKQLLAEFKRKEMSPQVNTVISEDMIFNADKVRNRLAYT